MPERSVSEVRPEYPFNERWAMAQARYKGTIRTFARNFERQITNMDREDIEQELLMILWKCVKNYDPDKGASFNTLFQGSAKNRCISLVRAAHTKGRDGITESLADEAVERAVDDAFERLHMPSTEDRVIQRMELQEYVSRYGTDVFLKNPKPGRRKKIVLMEDVG